MKAEDWQQFYLEDERPVSVPPSQCAEYAAAEFVRRGKRVILDLACGVGRDTFYLGNHGLNVVGVDAAAAGLAIASQLKAEHHHQGILARADATRLPFSNASFEGVYCFGLLHQFTEETGRQDIRQTMDEIYRLLKAGGVLILAVLSGDPDGGLPKVLFFTEQMFDAATDAFQLVEKHEYDDLGCTGVKTYKVWRGMFVKASRSVEASSRAVR